MILCFASWDRPGGLQTVFDAYFHDLKLNRPHFWILVGKSSPPAQLRNRKDTYLFTIPDDWAIYENSDACDSAIEAEIVKLAAAKGATGLFLPLEYHLFPYIKKINLPILYISHLLNKPLIDSAKRQWYRDLPEVKGGIFAETIRLTIEREAIHRSHFVVVSGRGPKEDLLEHYTTPQLKNVTTSAPGTHATAWQGVESGSKTQVLYLGRLTHQKGIPNLKVNPNSAIQLTVMGSGKLENWLKREALNVQLEPHQTNVRPYLDIARYCVFPSHYEPWGLSLTEALAAGKICLAQKGVYGHEAQIEQGRNGFLVDFNSQTIDDLVASLKLSEDELCEISQSARIGYRKMNDHLAQVSDDFSIFWEYADRFRKVRPTHQEIPFP